MPRIWPRRAERSPMTVPRNSSGTVTVIFETGSSRHGEAVHVVADERLRENQTAVARPGLNPEPDFGELAGTARLFFVAIARLAPRADCLAIGNSRLGEFNADAKTALQTLDDHLEVN